MNYDNVRKNLERANKGLLALRKKMSIDEYLEDRYLVRQVCIASVALACLNEGVDDYLAFQLSLNKEDRLLLLDLTGER